MSETPEEAILRLRVEYEKRRFQVLMQVFKPRRGKGPTCKCGLRMHKHPTRSVHWCPICNLFEYDLDVTIRAKHVLSQA